MKELAHNQHEPSDNCDKLEIDVEGTSLPTVNTTRRDEVALIIMGIYNNEVLLSEGKA